MVARLLTRASMLLAICLPASTQENLPDLKRSDDVTVSSLQVLMQQQASLIQQLQSDLAATKNRMSGLENTVHTQTSEIAVLKQKQSQAVAFTVRYSSDNSTGGIPLTPQATLIFDHVVYQLGNGYNTRSGIFTAPVPGVYSFYLTTMSVNAHESLYLSIVREGAILDLLYTEGNQDLNDQASTEVTCHLAAGQQVWVRHYHGDAVRGIWYTIFTGYLIHAD